MPRRALPSTSGPNVDGDTPTSLFGRALAESRLGQTAKADADVTAAHAIDPEIETTFAAWGLSR